MAPEPVESTMNEPALLRGTSGLVAVERSGRCAVVTLSGESRQAALDRGVRFSLAVVNGGAVARLLVLAGVYDELRAEIT
jgi:hypothetical protein